MQAQALKLANEMGVSNEHPDFPIIDWQEAVAKGDTLAGYWEWVIHEMHYQHHAWLDGDDSNAVA